MSMKNVEFQCVGTSCIGLMPQMAPPESRRPYRLAELGPAIGLAPQSLGLLGMTQGSNGGFIVEILAKGK